MKIIKRFRIREKILSQNFHSYKSIHLNENLMLASWSNGNTFGFRTGDLRLLPTTRHVYNFFFERSHVDQAQIFRLYPSAILLHSQTK